jgi:hypothetical protein
MQIWPLLPERPKIHERFAIIPGDDAGSIRLHSLTAAFHISDGGKEILPRLLGLVDGNRSLNELLESADSIGLTPQELLDILDNLAKAGVLTDSSREQ